MHSACCSIVCTRCTAAKAQHAIPRYTTEHKHNGAVLWVASSSSTTSTSHHASPTRHCSHARIYRPGCRRVLLWHVATLRRSVLTRPLPLCTLWGVHLCCGPRLRCCSYWLVLTSTCRLVASPWCTSCLQFRALDVTSIRFEASWLLPYAWHTGKLQRVIEYTKMYWKCDSCVCDRFLTVGTRGNTPGLPVHLDHQLLAHSGSTRAALRAAEHTFSSFCTLNTSRLRK